MVFARLSPEAHARAGAEALFYTMDAGADGMLCRFVCDWSKTEAEVDRLAGLVAG
jgi:threonine aldolase